MCPCVGLSAEPGAPTVVPETASPRGRLSGVLVNHLLDGQIGGGGGGKQRPVHMSRTIVRGDQSKENRASKAKGRNNRKFWGKGRGGNGDLSP